uniref:Uncharacterized protein n=1 Tax=Arundo donax TaxID=35708 RepID=A0A0A9AUS3_ARUDO
MQRSATGMIWSYVYMHEVDGKHKKRKYLREGLFTSDSPDIQVNIWKKHKIIGNLNDSTGQ